MDKPLLGKKILVTREKSQARTFVDKLKEVGATPLCSPLLTFKARITTANKLLLEELHDFTWVFFTSANGVKFFFELLSKYDIEFKNVVRFAVVGKKTAKALRNYGYHANFIPSVYQGEYFAKEFFKAFSTDQHVLLVCGNKSRQEIPNLLTKQQVFFRKAVVYDTLVNEEAEHNLHQYIHNDTIDALTFTSPSTIDAFLQLTHHSKSLIDSLKQNKVCVCIGSTTEQKAKLEGFKQVITPKEFTIEAMIEELINYFNLER